MLFTQMDVLMHIIFSPHVEYFSQIFLFFKSLISIMESN